MTEKPHHEAAAASAAAPSTPDRLRLSQISGRAPTPVDLRPDAAARTRLGERLGLLDLPRLRLAGRLAPAEGEAYRFEGRLEAEVVQPCSVTLEPVTTAIDEPVARTWSPHAASPEGADEAEMGDDELAPLGDAIDLAALMAEELSLALPPWPRAPGAELPGEAVDGGDGGGDTRKPFAGLADLLGRD